MATEWWEIIALRNELSWTVAWVRSRETAPKINRMLAATIPQLTLVFEYMFSIHPIITNAMMPPNDVPAPSVVP